MGTMCPFLLRKHGDSSVGCCLFYGGNALRYHMVKYLIGAVAVLIALTGVAGFLIINHKFDAKATYVVEGTLQFSSLQSKVRVVRDSRNNPYIYADSLDDALCAQGFITAQDRILQMHLLRSMARGRLSEIVGDKGVDVDKKSVLLGFRESAEKHARLLASDQRAYLQSFADGVNEFIEKYEYDYPVEITMGRIALDPWTIEDSLSIMYLMGWNSAANYKEELLSYKLIKALGFVRFKDLFPVYTNPDNGVSLSEPTQKFTVLGQNGGAFGGLVATEADHQLGVGSNSWAVRAERTSSGKKPILANDPHLDGRCLPGVFYPTSFILPDQRIAGATVPGIPGILIGRNKHLAVGFTNAYGDSQDIQLLKVDEEHENCYLFGGESVRLDVQSYDLKIKDEDSESGFRLEKYEVYRTQFGPVLKVEDGYCFVIRWTSNETMQPRLGIDYLVSAHCAKELLETIKDLTYIQLNVVYADDDNTIGYHVSGRYPQRARGGDGSVPVDVSVYGDPWNGFKPFRENPHSENPSSGDVVSANQMTTPASYEGVYSTYFAPEYRYNRIKQLLASKETHSPEDFLTYQADVYNPVAKELMPTIIDALRGKESFQSVVDSLERWDCEETLGSSETTLFHMLYEGIVRETFVDDLSDELLGEYLQDWYFWQGRFDAIMQDADSAWFDDKRTAPIENRDDIIRRVTKRILKKNIYRTDARPWGSVHTLRFFHPFGREGIRKFLFRGVNVSVPGSGETVYRARSSFGKPEEPIFVPTMRMVANLNDDDKVIGVLNGGVTGRINSPYFHDQLLQLNNNKTDYWWFSDEALQADSRSELVLCPN